MVRKILGTVLVCIGIGVALHQIVAYQGWQWREMLSFSHHEGIAFLTVVVGLLLWATALKWK